MIAYEIQLWYVSETKISPRQNPVQDKIESKKKSEKKIFCQKKILSRTLSQISSAQIDAYHHKAECTYRNEVF